MKSEIKTLSAQSAADLASFGTAEALQGSAARAEAKVARLRDTHARLLGRYEEEVAAPRRREAELLASHEALSSEAARLRHRSDETSGASPCGG